MKFSTHNCAVQCIGAVIQVQLFVASTRYLHPVDSALDLQGPLSPVVRCIVIDKVKYKIGCKRQKKQGQ